MSSAQRQRLRGARRRIREAPRPNLVERRMTKFLGRPLSIRRAAGVIVTATLLVVVAGGVLMRILDHGEYPSIWRGMWWATQTVTTVGYGDVTPHKMIGRLIAAFVMLEGVAFVAIVTAAVTASFVTRAEQERAVGIEEAGETEARLDDRFDELDRRLDRFETLLRALASPTDKGGSP